MNARDALLREIHNDTSSVVPSTNDQSVDIELFQSVFDPIVLQRVFNLADFDTGMARLRSRK